MSIPAVTNFADADPDAKLTTLQALIVVLRGLVSTVLPDDLMPYVIGSSIPSVDDQGKPWIRIAGDGTPFGTYVYKSGFWIREGPLLGARIGIYAGNPAIDFDGTGRGLKGVGPIAADAYGWALMNGQNGTGDISDKFIIAAHMSDLSVGYSSGWRTNVTGVTTGSAGASEVTLTADQVYRSAQNAIRAAKYQADGNTPSGDLYGVTNGSTDFDILAADAGNTTPDPVPTVPPFYALAYVQFIGYTY